MYPTPGVGRSSCARFLVRLCTAPLGWAAAPKGGPQPVKMAFLRPTILFSAAGTTVCKRQRQCCRVVLLNREAQDNSHKQKGATREQRKQHPPESRPRYDGEGNPTKHRHLHDISSSSHKFHSSVLLVYKYGGIQGVLGVSISVDMQHLKPSCTSYSDKRHL